MNLVKLVFILNICIIGLGARNVLAQEMNATSPEIEKIKAELLQEASKRGERDIYEPKWLGDFEALQVQVNQLMAQNAKLTIEEKTLTEEATRLEKEIQDKEKLNAELRSKVNGLKELSDNKAWEAKTTGQDKQFQDELKIRTGTMRSYDSKIKFLDEKIAVARLKLKMMGVEDNSDQLLALQEERDILEARIVSQSQREKELMAQLKEFKDQNKPLDPSVAALRKEADALRQQIAEIEDKQKGVTDKSGMTVYEQLEVLTKQKEQMAAENERLKSRIEEYRKAEHMGIENQRIKDLVEAISAVDAANNQINEEMGYLRENIAILRTRVKKMEYQADKLKAMKDKK